MQPISGDQCPDLVRYLMKMSLGISPPRKMHLCRCSSSVLRVPSFLEALQNPHVWLTSNKVQNPSPVLGKTTKVVRPWCAFAILTSTCASRHSGVHFLNSSTSKSAQRCGAFSVMTSKCVSRHSPVHFFENCQRCSRADVSNMLAWKHSCAACNF